jgi:hypothetical protein
MWNSKEKGPTDAHLVAEERVVGVDLHRIGADHPRVVSRVAAIVDEHRPHALRGRPHHAERGAASGGRAGAGRQGVEHDHLSGGQAVLPIRAGAEGCRAGDETEDGGSQHDGGPNAANGSMQARHGRQPRRNNTA